MNAELLPTTRYENLTTKKLTIKPYQISTLITILLQKNGFYELGFLLQRENSIKNAQ